jgi:hypothetical protein
LVEDLFADAFVSVPFPLILGPILLVYFSSSLSIPGACLDAWTSVSAPCAPVYWPNVTLSLLAFYFTRLQSTPNLIDYSSAH